MDSITQKDLETLTEHINKATDSPLEPHKRNGKKGERKAGFTANVGHYYLNYAYGGVKLLRIYNESGGVETVSTIGYATKRELYNWMRAFLAGINLKS